jgi:predicted DNA binding protein
MKKEYNIYYIYFQMLEPLPLELKAETISKKLDRDKSKRIVSESNKLYAEVVSDIKAREFPIWLATEDLLHESILKVLKIVEDGEYHAFITSEEEIEDDLGEVNEVDLESKNCDDEEWNFLVIDFFK